MHLCRLRSLISQKKGNGLKRILFFLRTYSVVTFVFTEKYVLTHYVSYSSKICVSTFSKTNVSDSGPRFVPFFSFFFSF